MTPEEWLAKILAGRPPLTPEQIAALRPIFAPVIPYMRTAPATATGAAPAMPIPTTACYGGRNAPR
jgi:hypothetical protein